MDTGGTIAQVMTVTGPGHCPKIVDTTSEPTERTPREAAGVGIAAPAGRGRDGYWLGGLGVGLGAEPLDEGGAAWFGR